MEGCCVKILITSGATQEPIDRVRFITNFSTGRTGARMAESLIRSGAEVTLLKGEAAAACENQDCETLSFKNFADLNSILQKLLREHAYDIVIHLAAVSDYSVRRVQQGAQIVDRNELTRLGKIDSSDSLTIDLEKNFKIIDRLRTYSLTPFFLVGFKLTCSEEAETCFEAIAALARRQAADLIVHNDLSDIERTGIHQFHIYQGTRLVTRSQSPEELAQVILSQVPHLAPPLVPNRRSHDLAL
jgi:phosphopantothenoylcysteine synthetase/decarboxylase